MALDPSLLLLSTLGSLPVAVYYMRFIGEAAIRFKRDEHRIPVAVRLDQRWAGALFRFLIALMIAGSAVWGVDFLFHFATASEALSNRPAATHGVSVAVFVGTLWSQGIDRVSRALLLVYLACIAFAVTMMDVSILPAISASYAVGFAAAALSTCLLRART